MNTRGLSYSIILHALMLLIIGIGIPFIFDRNRELQPMAISVEILPIAAISNVPKTQLPIKKEDPKPKPSPKKEEPPKPKPVVKEQPKPDTVAPPKPTPEKAKDKPKPEPKPKPKDAKKEEPKKDDAFEQLLKDLTEQEDSADTKEKPKEPTQNSAKSKSDNFDPTKPLSLSETDAIRSQFAQHWRLPAGVKDDYKLVVEVRVLVSPDGTITQAGIAAHQSGRYASDPAFRAAADSALRAVKLASPLQNLSADKYDTWKDMVVNFDPSEMLY